MPNTPNAAAVSPALADVLFEFGGFTIPAGCKRIFITAELEASNGDPRIQPTGFPDLGPVLYADPGGTQGTICLIESEASMANRLEEICLEDKYIGTLRSELTGIPYLALTADGTNKGAFVSASTIDGHRFASEYFMGAHVVQGDKELKALQDSAKTRKEKSEGEGGGTGKGKKVKAASFQPEFVRVVRRYMGMAAKDRCPAGNVPKIFQFAMEYDPMALLHGFQISVKDLTFVGLRSPRVITASILGLQCERITVPGVRFDPIGTADASQAIFQKQRISAKKIEARFSIDVGLLASLHLAEDPRQKAARLELLFAVALCKVSWFLAALETGLRLRTDCDLRLKDGGVRFWTERMDACGKKLNVAEIAVAATSGLAGMINSCGFADNHSPFLLKTPGAKDGEDAGEKEEGEDSDEDEESGDPS